MPSARRPTGPAAAEASAPSFTKAAALNAEESGSAPPVGIAARDHAFAHLASDDESAFNHGRNDRHAFSRINHLLGNSAVGRGHDFIEHLSSALQPVDIFFTIIRHAISDGEQHQSRDEHNLFHTHPPFEGDFASAIEDSPKPATLVDAVR